MTDLPAYKYLIEARQEMKYNPEHTVSDIRHDPSLYSNLIALARALERIAKLEKRDGSMMTIIGQLQETVKIIRRERDEALTKLAKYEPPIDPDLVLAREIVIRLGLKRMANHAQAIGNENASDLQVELALAGIKAGREFGGWVVSKYDRAIINGGAWGILLAISAYVAFGILDVQCRHDRAGRYWNAETQHCQAHEARP